jgi:hypothetical protein
MHFNGEELTPLHPLLRCAAHCGAGKHSTALFDYRPSTAGPIPGYSGNGAIRRRVSRIYPFFHIAPARKVKREPRFTYKKDHRFEDVAQTPDGDFRFEGWLA